MTSRRNAGFGAVICFDRFVQRIQGGDEAVWRPQSYNLESFEVAEVDFLVVSVPRSIKRHPAACRTLVMVSSRSAKVRLYVQLDCLSPPTFPTGIPRFCVVRNLFNFIGTILIVADLGRVFLSR
jgi:hypothetical protein